MCLPFSFVISRGPDWFWVSLSIRPSRGEEFRRALSIAVLGYGVAVSVLMLHALLAKEDGTMRERVSSRDSHTLPAHSASGTPSGFKELSGIKALGLSSSTS